MKPSSKIPKHALQRGELVGLGRGVAICVIGSEGGIAGSRLGVASSMEEVVGSKGEALLTASVLSSTGGSSVIRYEVGSVHSLW